MRSDYIFEASFLINNSDDEKYSYSKRMVQRTSPGLSNGGLGLSTALIPGIDGDYYETAILCPDNGVIPVQRYKTLTKARKGHDNWEQKLSTITEVKSLDGELIKFEREE